MNEFVEVCDMANVPLEDESVDVAVFCLSLMGTNFLNFIAEACRYTKLKYFPLYLTLAFCLYIFPFLVYLILLCSLPPGTDV